MRAVEADGGLGSEPIRAIRGISAIRFKVLPFLCKGEVGVGIPLR